MQKILRDFTVDSPVFPNDAMTVVRVRKTDTAKHAFELLISNNLSAIPIVDPEHHSEPIALFSVAQVVAFVVKHLDPHGTAVPTERDWSSWVLSNEKFAKFDALQFVHYCSAHYNIPAALAVASTTSLKKACHLLLEKKAHNLIVFDKEKDNRISNVVAASRLVEFLAAGIDSLPIARQAIGDFEGGLAAKKPLVAVFEEGKALSAFEQMIEKQVSCCAVIDGQQHISGNISLQDIKTLGADFGSIELLRGSALEFANAVRKAHPHGPGRTARPKAVTCSPLDPLRDVLALFSFYKVHHVFVVDGDDKPDLCRLGGRCHSLGAAPDEGAQARRRGRRERVKPRLSDFGCWDAAQSERSCRSWRLLYGHACSSTVD
jgi:CBS domain-containing protein